MSELLEPPAGGEPICMFLLREEEQEEMRRREVGCQWESPEEEQEEVQRREVAVQVESERRDAAVQVDLTWRHSGSSELLLQCLSLRAEGPHGGALLDHCSPPQTRTRTRTIQPAVRFSPGLSPPRPRSQRRPRPQAIPKVAPTTDTREEEQQEEEEEEGEQQEEEEEEEETGDPTWSPPEAGAPPQQEAQQEVQAAPLCAVKQEPDTSVCDVCGKVMKNKSSLARHSFIHTGQKPFSCPLCPLAFNRRDNLQHHLSRLHPHGAAKVEKQRQATAWLCAVCGKTFSCRSRLKTHEVIHSGVKPHRCDLCPKAYMRTNDLQHHRDSVHAHGAAGTPRPSSLLCHLCGKEFKCRSQLAVHFQTHTGERPHLCDICGRKFGRQYQLKRHKVLVHANRANGDQTLPLEAPFPCGVCGRRLKTEALLAAHARVHSAERPHRCSVCLRSFQSATCLKQHQVRVHLRVRVSDEPRSSRRKSPGAAKAFPCPVCAKVFKFKSLLASHALTHSEVRPYACDFCSRRFRRLSHLKRHRHVVHADGSRLPQSFVCHICGKDKKCRSQLARHVIIHTGERPFTCDLCPARFNRHGNLQQHRRRMHGIQPLPPDDPPTFLFDDDLAPALGYKQEETVVSVDMAAQDGEEQHVTSDLCD